MTELESVDAQLLAGVRSEDVLALDWDGRIVRAGALPDPVVRFLTLRALDERRVELGKEINED